MYLPKHFEVTDISEIADFVAQVGSADLVSVSPSGFPEATLLPCTWNLDDTSHAEYGSLVMHMARANQQWKTIGAGAQGLAIIHGPQAYVSPSNYESKTTDHKVVPTWNYQSVHLSGTIEVSEDVELLKRIVTHLTDSHESQRNDPWHASEADPTYFNAQLRGIVAVILRVSKVEAKYKLSQNRSIADRERVIADLESSNEAEDWKVAKEMKKRSR